MNLSKKIDWCKWARETNFSLSHKTAQLLLFFTPLETQKWWIYSEKVVTTIGVSKWSNKL